MTIKIHQFTCRTDNFGVLMHDTDSGLTALIDAPEELTILAAIEETGWKPDMILTTHHHVDHVEANLALKLKFNLKIIGPKGEADKIPGIDEQVVEGDTIPFGSYAIEVIETPGHTAGHISFFIADAGIAFTADTLFALGCGRLFEAPPPVMYDSLKKLAALPPQTVVYFGHEYTLSNAKFALTIDPENPALQERAEKIESLRAEGRDTGPTTIGEELATNPFLRWGDAGVRKTLGLESATDAEVFAEIRKRKDSF